MVDGVRVEEKRCPDQRRVVHEGVGESARHSSAEGAQTPTEVKQLRPLVAPSSSAFVKRNPANPPGYFKKKKRNNPA